MDMQQELYARNSTTIPEQQQTMTISPASPVGVLPVPSGSLMPLPETVRLNALQELKHIIPSNNRARIRLVYHGRDFTDANAEIALQQIGFHVFSADSLISRASNTIVLGDSVSLADVRAVAMVLLGTGIKLSRIRRLQHNPANSWSLEIDSVPYALDWPPLSVDQVNQLTSSR